MSDVMERRVPRRPRPFVGSGSGVIPEPQLMSRRGAMEITPTPLPPAPQLAEPHPESLPMQTQRIMKEATDQATDQVIGELQALIGEVNRLIEGLEATRSQLHDHMGRHFQLGAEALAFRDKVRDRLSEITHPAQVIPAEQAELSHQNGPENAG